MFLTAQGSTGHSRGAAGGFEAVACVKALETGTVPPTANYETPDPDCDLDYTPNKVRLVETFGSVQFLLVTHPPRQLLYIRYSLCTSSSLIVLVPYL